MSEYIDLLILIAQIIANQVSEKFFCLQLIALIISVCLPSILLFFQFRLGKKLSIYEKELEKKLQKEIRKEKKEEDREKIEFNI